MAKRQIYDSERHAHFVTFSCYKRRKLLDHDDANRKVLGALNAQLQRLDGKCVGFVVMPEHVHSLVWFLRPGRLSEFMKQWKRTSSVRIRELFSSKLRHYGQYMQGTPVWQAKYYSFNVYSSEKLLEKLNYMHLNPVRAGLVDKACKWRWSSAPFYELGSSVGVPVEWLD